MLSAVHSNHTSPEPLITIATLRVFSVEIDTLGSRMIVFN